MTMTNRKKYPKCRWCGRTLKRDVATVTGWRHKHTENVECTRGPQRMAEPKTVEGRVSA